MTMKVICLGVLLIGAAACGGADNSALSAEDSEGPTRGDQSGNNNTNDGAGNASECPCQPGFVCEFNQCVPEGSSAGSSTPARDPQSSERYVYSLQPSAKRLVRIDSENLIVDSFSAGLAPTDLAVVADRDITILLDAFDLAEILDHRESPPLSVTFETARSLSHVVASPTGAHAIAFYDWDDPQSGIRQSEPGNINQLTVISLSDADISAGADVVRNIAVGLLPRDIRFSIDGSRAVVVGRDTVTRVNLSPAPVVAVPEPVVSLRAEPLEILVDGTGEFAIARYDDEIAEVVALADGSIVCFDAVAPVVDVDVFADGRFLVIAGDDTQGYRGSEIDTESLPAGPDCAPLVESYELGAHPRVVIVQESGMLLAYTPSVDHETLRIIDGAELTDIPVEKGIAGVVVAPGGEVLYIAHLKSDGTPAWDPLVEHPDVSIDKSYGVSWLNLATLEHRLAISETPFGRFTFVPPRGVEPASTYVAISDASEPEILRVEHNAGFDDTWTRLAAPPLRLGYLAGTERTYVTQDHPWGRVTFIDPSTDELRHVTGFALLED